MKAAGITLSTVGAGGGAEPVPRAARRAGRRPLLRRRQPGLHPGHLPQGDPAGLRPADRGGAVLPDPDLVVADPARHRGRAARSCWATTGRRPSRPPRRSSSRPATIRSSPSGSTGSAGPSPGRPTRPGRWAKSWVGWNGLLAVLQPAGGLDVPGRGERRHRGGVRRPRRATRTCASRASTPTARRATSTRPAWRSSGPDLEPATVEPRPGGAGRLRGAGRRRSRAAPTRCA